MVNRQMKAAAALRVARAAARRNGHAIQEQKGRGKGSHVLYAVVNKEGTVLARFTMTSHARDVSVGVLREIERGLSHLFGEKWMEKA